MLDFRNINAKLIQYNNSANVLCTTKINIIYFTILIYNIFATNSYFSSIYTNVTKLGLQLRPK